MIPHHECMNEEMSKSTSFRIIVGWRKQAMDTIQVKLKPKKELQFSTKGRPKRGMENMFTLSKEKNVQAWISPLQDSPQKGTF